MENKEIVFGVEEERFTREKHGYHSFPEQSIKSCLEYCDIEIGDVNRVVVPWETKLNSRRIGTDFRRILASDESILKKLQECERAIEKHIICQTSANSIIRNQLAHFIGKPVPEIVSRPHHKCHAASAFHASKYTEAVVITADGVGEYDSLVVWEGKRDGLSREKTYEYPNSLGHFYRCITTFLGYAPETRSEGKIMGLAPYGSFNEEIEKKLKTVVSTGIEFDVTDLVGNGIRPGVAILEDIFNRSKKDWAEDFTQWEMDLAFMAQLFLEETMLEITEHHVDQFGVSNVGLAGGVALNSKMNKRIRESQKVDSVFVQPVAHDGGLPIGATMLEHMPEEVAEMDSVYLGPEYRQEEIKRELENYKLQHVKPDNLQGYIAEKLAEGMLVGWFQGRMELGPRALGNRSILADPRNKESRARVNENVKHREQWRPFAPSLLEEAKEDYLVEADQSPFMIMTFDTREKMRDEIQAVLHPGDHTVRPQLVTKESNPKYYSLIKEFESLTDVPVILNTSFNDSGEPIVNTPREAIRDFFSMGLDLLVLDNFVVKKPAS